MDAWKAQRAANEAARVRVPKGNGCWAWVRKPSNGSMLARTVGRWGNCSRSARVGHRTCAQHAHLEVAAQSLSVGAFVKRSPLVAGAGPYRQGALISSKAASWLLPRLRRITVWTVATPFLIVAVVATAYAIGMLYQLSTSTEVGQDDGPASIPLREAWKVTRRICLGYTHRVRRIAG